MKKIFTLIFFVFVFDCRAQQINSSLQYSVHLPAKAEGKNPVLILLHGYGSNETDLMDMASTFDGRLLTISLRAPITTAGGGYCWYHINYDEKGIRTYNYPEAVQSRKKILAFISEACRVYNADSNNVYLLGFSQGAIMSYDILLHAPQKVKGIIALSGRIMKEDLKMKSETTVFTDKRVFIGHGLSDNVIPAEESNKASQFLKLSGCKNVSYQTYEMPHSINGNELKDIKFWLATNLKK